MMDLRDHRAIEAQAAEWLARRDAAERWTDADEQALQAWVAASAANRVAWLRLGAAWQRTERMPALAEARDDVAREATAITTTTALAAPTAVSSPRVAERRPRRRVAIAAALAASVAIAAAIPWGIAQFRVGEGQRYATDVGAREAVVLADGSRVTLNTNTRGRAVVNEQRRRFWLDEGEAYFEVAHDPKRPFVIMAGKDTITVLGTRFSVRHVDGRTVVTVVEGKVRLDLAQAGGAPAVPVVVTGNEAALAETGSVLVIGRTAEQVANELSWRKGQIAFDQKTLTEIADEFNRYNRVQLVVEGEAADLRLSGNFDAENVEAFARLAHEGLGLRVVRDGERIVLSDE